MSGDDARDAGSWRLWRQDDHGNAFPMALFTDREEADAECRRYNAQPHHQHYWVAPCQDHERDADTDA